MTNHRYHKFNTHGRLKTVMLGSYYSPDYFAFIDNETIRLPLMKIAQEINQDLDYFEKVLVENNVKVLRPELPTVAQFCEYFVANQKFLPPPLQPRNNHAVIGNQCYQFCDYQIGPTQLILQTLSTYNSNIVNLSDQNYKFYSHSINQVADQCYNSQTDIWYRRQKYNELAGSDWPKFEDYVQGARSTMVDVQTEMNSFASEFVYNSREFGPLSAPNIIPIGQSIVVDSNEYCNYAEWVLTQMKIDLPIISINTTAGHTDGCFTILGNNIILGIDPLIDYNKYFPDYQIIAVPTVNYQDYIHHWSNNMSNKIQGAWWVPGEETNKSFTEFVDQYLAEFTGFSAESIFDVNVLALDQNTIFVNNNQTAVTNQLNRVGIETIEIPWRHRFFVDGGLHCITLDLDRE
jgi:hypothetical protein